MVTGVGRVARVAYGAKVVGRLWGIGRTRTSRTCTICRYSGRFLFYGDPPRFDALCPGCGSLERHRLLALCADRIDLFQNRSILHFAPEPAVTALIRASSSAYASADLRPGRADLTLDLESIDQPDQSWEAVVASHVLEHVDDRRALGELLRVLRPGGLLIAMVPLIEGWEKSYEDPAVTTPAARELHFGQCDHVRYYGRDFESRLKAAGFTVTTFQATGTECVTHGLTRGEKVYVCQRP